MCLDPLPAPRGRGEGEDEVMERGEVLRTLREAFCASWSLAVCVVALERG